MACSRTELLDFIGKNKASFARDFAVSKIGLFGSFARDEATDESDIDIVVELEKADMFYLIGIKQALEEKFNRRVDVVRMRDHMNVYLRRRIEKDAIYV